MAITYVNSIYRCISPSFMWNFRHKLANVPVLLIIPSCCKTSFLYNYRKINSACNSKYVRNCVNNFSLSTDGKLENSEANEKIGFIVSESTKDNEHETEKTELKNKNFFSKYLHLMKIKNYKKHNLLLEGEYLINRGIKHGIKLEALFYTSEEALSSIKLNLNATVKAFRVSNKTYRNCLGLNSTSEIVAVGKLPNSLDIKTSPTLPVTVLCSNVRDPENMSSIIKIAAAVGCKTIVLLKGCVNPWERKVLNEAHGAHFQIPIIYGVNWSGILKYVSENAAFYIADNVSEIDLHDSQVFYGVDFKENMLHDEYSNAENSYTSLSDGKEVHMPQNLTETAIVKHEQSLLPCYLYSSVTFPKSDIVLYVGGEVEGIDPRIEKLAYKFKGQKIKIPLENDVESLNVCSALVVILYEIKRQFLVHREQNKL